MSGPAISPQRPELVTDGVPSARPRWLELATSTDHKDVGRMMIAAALGFLALALLEFLLIRAQLVVPENALIEPVTFNRLLSVMGASLVVLFILPLALGLFAYLVPLQIGARSLAFPRLANLSFWLYVIGGAVLYVSFVYTPPEAGFNPLPPLSDTAFISNNGVDVWITAVGLSALGFLLLALNLIVTIRRLRAPGLAWRRLPPFTFSAAVSSWVLVVACPAMIAGTHDAGDRPPLQRRLLRSRPGRRPHLLAASELDLLHRLLPADGAAGRGGDLGDRRHLLAQAADQPARRQPLDGGDRRTRPARLDAEHVHRLDPRRLALLRDGGRAAAAGPGRAAVRELAGDDGFGRDRAASADAVRDRRDLDAVIRARGRARSTP